MTHAERLLYFDHLQRGRDYVTDQALMRWVLARHARTRGNTFVHLEIP